MKMDSGLDTGDILLQSRTPIGESETAPELMTRLSTIGAELLTETIHSLGTIIPVQQEHSHAIYAPIMKRSDGLIDWRNPASEISRRVLGFQPFPNAFTMLGGLRLTIWTAAASMASNKFQPGEVIEAHGDRLVVGCGEETILEIREIQLEGKRRMNVRDFLNGVSVPVGSILG
jgi:methionyl-tRNA formyltransferase